MDRAAGNGAIARWTGRSASQPIDVTTAWSYDGLVNTTTTRQGRTARNTIGNLVTCLERCETAVLSIARAGGNDCVDRDVLARADLAAEQFRCAAARFV